MRLRLPAVLATISTCSGPAFLNSTAFSVPSMMGLSPVKRHRPVVNLHLAHVDQAIDEIAQTVFVEVDVRRSVFSSQSLL